MRLRERIKLGRKVRLLQMQRHVARRRLTVRDNRVVGENERA